MARTLTTNLKQILASDAALTDTTLELQPRSGSPIRIATSPLVISGNSFSGDLRESGEIAQAIGQSTDRLTVRIQNVDSQFVALVHNGTLDGAEAIVGRYYQPLYSGQTAEWIELFRGRVTPLSVTEEIVELEIVNDLAGTGLSVAAWTLSEKCQFVFKDLNCGYTGGLTSCNKIRRSLDGCLGRNNEHRFGGMEFPEPQMPEADSGDGGGIGSEPGAPPWGNCFLGETMVTMTPQTQIDFRTLYEQRDAYIGAEIISWDDDRQPARDEIVNIFRHVADYYHEVSFEDGDVWAATPEHPVLTPKNHWVGVGQLAPGDEIMAAVIRPDGDYAAITWMQRRVAGIRVHYQTRFVYNLTTRRYHRYFANTIAVHNTKLPDVGY